MRPPISVAVFGEDSAHEAIIVPLIELVCRVHGIRVRVATRSCFGGSARAIREASDFVSDLLDSDEDRPDVLVLGIDANCMGRAKKAMDINRAFPEPAPFSIVLAIPDPHIERWLLLDSAAFKRALGAGCSVPKNKCERDRYKKALASAVRHAGLEVLLGGLEHAEAIISNVDLQRARRSDKSLDAFVADLLSSLKHLLNHTSA